MDGETVEGSLFQALNRRLACYISANESVLALAKLASHTWLQNWVFAGHPSVGIGSLVTHTRYTDVFMVRSSRLKDFDVLFEAHSLFDDDLDVLKTPEHLSQLSNTLAFECIRCDDPERLDALDVALLEEVAGQEEVNAFHYAAALGNVDCLAVLIRKLGVSCPLLARTDGKLASRIVRCCGARFPFGNREGVLHLLLSLFGLKSFGSDALQSLLKSASEYGALWLMSFVFSRMADLGVAVVVDLNECLRIASENGHTDCARMLLEHGADASAKVSHGYSALMHASLQGHIDCARLLLEHGADVNAKNFLRYSALMRASENGRTDCARLLLDHGADVNAKNRGGRTALISASIYGHTDVARLLLEHGAEVNAIDRGGHSAWMYASQNIHTDCARLLLEHGARKG